MTACLQDFLDTGLVKSKFVNVKIRQLSAETSHEFIEWCGLVQGHQKNSKLDFGYKLVMQDLYYDFINEYPDYAPKAKMTISRTRFYKWLVAYANFSTGQMPEEGRDMTGRWFRMKENKDVKTKD
jgi:hypothetical protein